MTKSFLRTVSTGLLICLCLSNGAIAFASGPNKTVVAFPPTQDLVPARANAGADTAGSIKVLLAEKSDGRLGDTTVKKQSRQAIRRGQKVYAHHSSARLAVPDDCDACHQGCLAASLTCIAISVITGCLPCGVACLAGQVAWSLLSPHVRRPDPPSLKDGSGPPNSQRRRRRECLRL